MVIKHLSDNYEEECLCCPSLAKYGCEDCEHGSVVGRCDAMLAEAVDEEADRYQYQHQKDDGFDEVEAGGVVGCHNT